MLELILSNLSDYGATMPSYRIRYVCQTSLRSDKDLAFEYRGCRTVFLFSRKIIAENTVHVYVEIEGENFADADIRAHSFLPPVLDAVSFSTGTPLLVLHWDLITKDESGCKTRRAIWCQKTETPIPIQIEQDAIDEARKILAQDAEPTLNLCWHRYALQRNLTLDRFVFQWLAFEGLAGKKQIPTICPACRTEATHCETRLTHEGSDRDKAQNIFSRCNPDVSAQEFKRDIWGRARNSVFHGSMYPSPELL